MGATAMLELWVHVDLLCATEEELLQWVPGEEPAAAGAGAKKKKQANRNVEGLGGEKLARVCLGMCKNARAVVVKRGKAGASWCVCVCVCVWCFFMD